ncbi:hypothetical protein N7535_003833 [Penicillium sp. DV-2018c]|nr:hypothetical protein N7535_003833 [Penicillium sp. DV-2018c]
MDAPGNGDALPSAEALNANRVDIEGNTSPLQRKRRNRPSLAKRRRYKKRLLQARMEEPEQALPKPTVPASSAQDSSLTTSSSSTPLSALAPALVPACPMEELHSGPPSPVPSEDRGTDQHDNLAPPQRPSRRHHRQRKA